MRFPETPPNIADPTTPNAAALPPGVIILILQQ